MSLGTEKQRTEGIKRQADELIEQAYQRGFKAGKVAWEEKTKDFFVEQGRREAWEAAKKLILNPSDNGIDYKDFHVIFGCWNTISEVMKNYSASEAIEKIKTYEEQKKIENEIKVGDEVYLLDQDHRTVVTCILENGDSAVCISSCGKWSVNAINQLHKTGRHFDEVDELLKKLGETNG